MTSSRVERISGYEVRCLISEKRRYVYALYSGEVEIVQATGSTPAEALDRLVVVNFDRVGHIAWEQQRARCLMCARFSPRGLQRHHIVPRSKGRSDSRLNIAMLDYKCHQAVTDGKELAVHPRMAALMLEHGLEFTPTGWTQRIEYAAG